MASETRTHWITDRKQIAALASPVRQEIVDAVSAIGPCSIAALAEVLARHPDRLYFHVRRLASVGLLVVRGISGKGRQAAAIYDVPSRRLRIRYSRKEKNAIRAAGAVYDGVLRLARRDFHRAIALPQSVLYGAARDTTAGRAHGWLTPAEVRQLNRLIEEMLQLLRHRPPRKGAKSIALTYVMVPTRRQRAAPKPPGDQS